MQAHDSGPYSPQGRLEQIGERLRALRQRDRELQEQAGAFSGRRERVRRSAELVRLAELRAASAAEAAEAAYLRAGQIHERAANLHDYLADSGIGDVERHRARAVEHRALAAADRATAAGLQIPRRGPA
ncbi:hypothetical protein [Spirillospora sp. NPDC047279]|uniref:hypothetical protein n=1 Tax=Spirillospora sp. NPDC047279 TaxID=3155478 RepID=UPI0034007BDE